MTRITVVTCLALMLLAAPAGATVSRYVHNTAVRTAGLYDPATGTWAPAASMNTARAYFGTVKLTNGQMLVAGGFGAHVQSLADAETYDPATNTSTPTANAMQTARGDVAIALLGDGRAVIAGGQLTHPTDQNLNIRVIAYSVKATTGARIEVSCSRGCKRTVATGRGAKAVLIGGLKGRRLANGTRVTVTVSMPGRLTTTVYDSIARGRRGEGRPCCTAPGTLGPLLGC